MARELQSKNESQKLTIEAVKREESGLNLTPQISKFMQIVTMMRVVLLPQLIVSTAGSVSIVELVGTLILVSVVFAALAVVLLGRIISTPIDGP